MIKAKIFAFIIDFFIFFQSHKILPLLKLPRKNCRDITSSSPLNNCSIINNIKQFHPTFNDTDLILNQGKL